MKSTRLAHSMKYTVHRHRAASVPLPRHVFVSASKGRRAIATPQNRSTSIPEAPRSLAIVDPFPCFLARSAYRFKRRTLS